MMEMATHVQSLPLDIRDLMRSFAFCLGPIYRAILDWRERKPIGEDLAGKKDRIPLIRHGLCDQTQDEFRVNLGLPCFSIGSPLQCTRAKVRKKPKKDEVGD
jgi:hypothetical protein